MVWERLRVLENDFIALKSYKSNIVWVDLCSPKTYVEVLISGIYGCGLIWT